MRSRRTVSSGFPQSFRGEIQRTHFVAYRCGIPPIEPCALIFALRQATTELLPALLTPPRLAAFPSLHPSGQLPGTPDSSDLRGPMSRWHAFIDLCVAHHLPAGGRVTGWVSYAALCIIFVSLLFLPFSTILRVSCARTRNTSHSSIIGEETKVRDRLRMFSSNGTIASRRMKTLKWAIGREEEWE